MEKEMVTNHKKVMEMDQEELVPKIKVVKIQELNTFVQVVIQ